MKIKLIRLLVILVLTFFAYTGAITLFFINNASDSNYKSILLPRLHQDALERYSGGLKIKTISKANYDETNFEEFEKFINYLKKTYPVIFKKAEFTRINKYALVFKINGKNKQPKFSNPKFWQKNQRNVICRFLQIVSHSSVLYLFGNCRNNSSNDHRNNWNGRFSNRCFIHKCMASNCC